MISYCKEYKPLLVLPLIACMVFSLASAGKVFHWRHDENVQNNINAEQMLWYEDILSLPVSVAYPGHNWLNRIANKEATTTTNTYTWGKESFSSVYAAILDGKPWDHPCRNFNAYVNSIFVPTVIAEMLVSWTGSLIAAHYLMCYIRNFIAATIIYYATAGIFHYFCYIHPVSSQIFEQARRTRPTNAIIWHQIQLAQSSIFFYVLLPVADEYVVENGWTLTYYTVAEIGGFGWYTSTMIFYFALVEIGVYWMHRTLHSNKWLFRNIHSIHHQYKTPEMLSPWASIAFHPLDGILEAFPYFAFMFIVPCHYLTHVILLFFTAIWATYIHDTMDWNIDPVMGSKYHTVHHTHYIYNYGQIFTFCDRFWGTFRRPLEPTGTVKQRFV